MTSEKCPLCGGQLEPRQVEKVLRGGEHSTRLLVNAEVCLWCGERVYTTESVARFERVRRKLARGDLAKFDRVGDSESAPVSAGTGEPPSERQHGADNGISAWVIRGGREGQWEDAFIENGLASIDFGFRQSVSEFASQMELRDHLLKDADARFSSVRSAAAAASQLWRFANVVNVGDVALMPRKGSAVVAAGRVSGEYVFQPYLAEPQLGPHTRSMEWLSDDIPRSGFDPDINNSMGGHKTVFQMNAEDASCRVMFTLKAHLAESRSGGQPAETRNGDRVSGELDRQRRHHTDVIARLQRLSPARVATLVAEVMRASGYVVSRPHFDKAGTINLLAAKGDLGFEQPAVSVSVNVGNGLVEAPEYERFRQEVASGRQGANRGLMISLSGFAETVHSENERLFFHIRLWGPDELARRLRDTYDDLPQDIRAEIPLADRKVLIETEA